jgi:hypothetical protein
MKELTCEADEWAAIQYEMSKWLMMLELEYHDIYGETFFHMIYRISFSYN